MYKTCLESMSGFINIIINSSHLKQVLVQGQGNAGYTKRHPDRHRLMDTETDRHIER